VPSWADTLTAGRLNPRFNKEPKLQRDITEYDHAHPYRVLYVSVINQYKHQWHVVEAVAALRQKGLHVARFGLSARPQAVERSN